MNHIELALSVLRKEISKLNYDLRYGNNLPEQEEALMEQLQKLNRAINDISKMLNS